MTRFYRLLAFIVAWFRLASNVRVGKRKGGKL